MSDQNSVYGDTSCFSCADCGVQACDRGVGKRPVFCPTEKMSPEERGHLFTLYGEAENASVMRTAAQVECEGYCRLSRVEETIDFAKRMGFRVIGIATCVGLIRESRMLTKILRAHGFTVYCVACKMGGFQKTEMGIPPQCNAVGATACNPIAQARYLNSRKTDMNIVMGLCVGHDMLFYKYVEGLTTTLVVKDRVTGHNPVAALYQAESYYRKKLAAPDAQET